MFPCESYHNSIMMACFLQLGARLTLRPAAMLYDCNKLLQYCLLCKLQLDRRNCCSDHSDGLFIN